MVSCPPGSRPATRIGERLAPRGGVAGGYRAGPEPMIRTRVRWVWGIALSIDEPPTISGRGAARQAATNAASPRASTKRLPRFRPADALGPPRSADLRQSNRQNPFRRQV